MISYHHTALYLTVTLRKLKTMDTKIIPSMVLCHVERKIRPITTGIHMTSSEFKLKIYCIYPPGPGSSKDGYV